MWLDDQIALVETKGPAALSRVDHTLYQLGVRPRGFSKYVTAASSLVPDIASNDVRGLQTSGIVHYRALEF